MCVYAGASLRFNVSGVRFCCYYNDVYTRSRRKESAYSAEEKTYRKDISTNQLGKMSTIKYYLYIVLWGYQHIKLCIDIILPKRHF